MTCLNGRAGAGVTRDAVGDDETPVLGPPDSTRVLMNRSSVKNGLYRLVGGSIRELPEIFG
jgi:hypothetical protein